MADISKTKPLDTSSQNVLEYIVVKMDDFVVTKLKKVYSQDCQINLKVKKCSYGSFFQNSWHMYVKIQEIMHNNTGCNNSHCDEKYDESKETYADVWWFFFVITL